VEDAQDLTQEFFARVLERHWLARADQAKGRFRTFLLTAMERFLANEWDKVRALKRGGGHRNIPIPARYGGDALRSRSRRTRHTPEQAFEYRWALALLDEVVQPTRGGVPGQESGGKCCRPQAPAWWANRARSHTGSLPPGWAWKKGPVKVAVHRMRQRYR